jgi:hypothetical protein
MAFLKDRGNVVFIFLNGISATKVGTINEFNIAADPRNCPSLLLDRSIIEAQARMHERNAII